MSRENGGGDAADDDREPPSRRDRLGTARDRFLARFEPASHALGRWTRHARSTAVLDRCRTIAANAWLVRWLTTEPSTETIVIDLRETWSLGPILAVVERLHSPFAAAAGTATVGRLGRRLEGWVGRYAVPLASAVLLAVVATTAVDAWPTVGPLQVAALVLAAIAGLVGLGVDRSREVLARSRAARVVVAAVTPPSENSTDETGARSTRR